MSSLIFLSDLHLSLDQPIARRDDAPAMQLAKLAYVFAFAKRHPATRAILQAGDFFHAPRSWRTLSCYADLIYQSGTPPIYCVAGQHDDYMYNENAKSATSLGILEAAGFVTILNDTPVVLDSIKKTHIYGCSFSSQQVPAVRDKAALNILVIHATISDSTPWVGADNFTLAPHFLREHKNFDIILCGDIHKKFYAKSGKRFLCNTGPILRREASEDMFAHHPGFFHYEIEKDELTWYEIPHKPADEVLTREHIETPQEVQQLLGEFIASMQQGQHIIPSMQFKQNLVNYIRQNEVPDPVRKILTDIMGAE